MTGRAGKPWRPWLTMVKGGVRRSILILKHFLSDPAILSWFQNMSVFFFRICQVFFRKTLSQIEILYPWILLAPRECTTESFAGLCSSIYEFIRCCSMSHRGSSKNRSEAVPVVPPNHRRRFGICNPLLIHTAVVAEVAVCAGPVYGTYHPGCTNVLCAKTLKSTKAQKTQGKSAPKWYGNRQRSAAWRVNEI